jgi:SAM-dependent methyltransferase
MTDETDLNRAWWDERARLHGQDGLFYDTRRFLAGMSSLHRRELAELEAAAGSLEGIDLLHMQCHIGLGSLSLARMGARVTGLDFSPAAIERARAVASEAGLEAEFLLADAQDLPSQLAERFDCVFASYGVLVWIADPDAWMRSVTSALRPGGKLVLIEGHPILPMVRSVDPPLLDGPYQGGRPVRQSRAGDYAHPDATTSANETVLYFYGLGEVATAAVTAGLRIDAITEWLDEERAPDGGKLIKEADGHFRLAFAGSYLPVTYSLRATKP